MINKYIEIQDEFFKYVADNNNMSFEEVEMLFNEYSMVIKTNNEYTRNCDLDWLSSDEREFIYNLYNSNLEYMTCNIRNVKKELGVTSNLGR